MVETQESYKDPVTDHEGTDTAPKLLASKSVSQGR